MKIVSLNQIIKPAVIATVGLFVCIPAQMGLGLTPSATAATAISINIFYDRLVDHGSWVNFRGGYVFTPRDVPRNWRPYTIGHWQNTDRFGWLWVSDEPFGWATYHYGRWAYDDDIGWYWIPGRKWAPAWVSWRRSSHNVFWAPLPPRNDPDLFVQITVEIIPDYYWVVVPARRFLDVDIARVAINDRGERQRFLRDSQRVGPVVVQNNIVINNVIDVDFIRQATGKEVRSVKVEQTDRPGQASITNDTVSVFGGDIQQQQDAKPKSVENDAKARERQAKRADKVNEAEKTTSVDESDKGSVPSQAQTNQPPGKAPDNQTADQPADKNKPADANKPAPGTATQINPQQQPQPTKNNAQPQNNQPADQQVGSEPQQSGNQPKRLKGTTGNQNGNPAQIQPPADQSGDVPQQSDGNAQPAPQKNKKRKLQGTIDQKQTPAPNKTQGGDANAEQPVQGQGDAPQQPKKRNAGANTAPRDNGQTPRQTGGKKGQGAEPCDPNKTEC